MHWCPILPSVWCSGLVFSVLACLSVDVTGALVLLQLISLLLSFLLCACPFSMFSLRFASCFTLVKRTMLCTNIVCAALCLFGGLVVPCMSCPPGLVGLCCFCASVSAPRCLPGFVALLAVLVWALLLPLLSALFCGGSFLCPLCLPPPRVVLFGALVQLVPWRAGTSLWVSG